MADYVAEYAGRDAVEWLIQHDPYVSPQWAGRCLALGEYIVARDKGGELCGFIRYSMFWGGIPYMDMVRVPDPALRHKGIGSIMYRFWEKKMREAGARVLMTSSTAHEKEPQEWHKRNGFLPSGRLTFGVVQDEAEIFFIKQIEGPDA